MWREERDLSFRKVGLGLVAEDHRRETASDWNDVGWLAVNRLQRNSRRYGRDVGPASALWQPFTPGRPRHLHAGAVIYGSNLRAGVEKRGEQRKHELVVPATYYMRVSHS